MYMYMYFPYESQNIFPNNVNRFVIEKQCVYWAVGTEFVYLESRWGQDFQHPSRPAVGPTQPNIQWETGLFPGGKAAGAWSWPPTLI
jgi:hypothetical protein